MVKVAFFKGKGNWASALIRWWTEGPYSHSEVIVQETAGSYLCCSSFLPDGGVRCKWRNDITDAEWDLVEINADPIAVQKWYTDRAGCKYDLLGLIGLVWRRDGYDRNKYFCSEANAASLGFNEAWRLDPNALKSVIDRLAIEQTKGK